ncbi:NTP transferase domain-containing protein [Corallococcus exiguus]|uniref:mannose-1-phosphate guanylyltransferase n=1 Tax=Corallococcus TaxID=83461 RepID=UPI000EA26547|nr:MULTISPECIES: mannose-1-phosphate guanylyltransferase [Corallococcus]NPC72596.1 NTP transferase domain-containing protein [Corallococcus exiguus]NPD24486.1 NTP transferase domain-containing protein [Corallococcus exiguus]NRD45541.1 NTP transferase domain-containing protein [Corallococcus exiguus]NRD64614.1 NTP transferase domain-containing protein [Corallococcus exiguus]RKH23760.1 mannose-1-phosphate guanylyltransferase [Corallococcus sp. CA041A]
MALYPVIMAGGSGTRFWPLSRQARPKQFLPLASKQPLLTDTAQRLKGLAPVKNTFIVCGPVHAKTALKLVKGLPKGNLLVEPVARNTAPAIALAALQVAARDPKGVLAVLPSDHHVADVKGFQRTLAEAARIAEGGHIVTLGIKPARPETGYGYIQVGAALDGGGRRVKAFKEKPDLKTAQEYLAGGDYLWNGGIFVFRADVMLEAFKQHMPEMQKGLDALQKAAGKRTFPAVLKRVFPKLPSISIDYGVMEKAENIAVLDGDFGWSDVGSFAAIPEVRPADAQGNVVSGDAVLVDCTNCVVLSDKRTLSVVGMHDVVVVDSGDAVLVVPKDKSQDVRKVVEALKARKRTKLL